MKKELNTMKLFSMKIDPLTGEDYYEGAALLSLPAGSDRRVIH